MNGGTERIVCPLKLYHGGTEPDATTAVSNDRRWTTRNYLAIDALEMNEISCDGGKAIRRLCCRTIVRIPWTPVLFLAVRPTYLPQLRRDLNGILYLRGSARVGEQSSSTTGVCAKKLRLVRALVRTRGQTLWCEREDMSLFELTFDSFRSRGLALSFLKGNAFALADEYCLFATCDNIAFEVALVTYARTVAPPIVTTTAGIELRESFEMFSWCRANERRGNVLQRLSLDNTDRLGLPRNPLDMLPVVCYDIETIANNMNAVPRGVRPDHRLSSLAITVNVPSQLRFGAAAGGVTSDGNATNESWSLTFMYAPHGRTESSLEKEEVELNVRLRDTLGAGHSVFLYKNERHMLEDAVKTLSENIFLRYLYNLENPRDAERLACALMGYNSWEYDYAFLYCRLHFYGLHERALDIQQYWREPRFCQAQVSFDLMQHVRARYQAQVGSLALSRVAEFFGVKDTSERGMSARSRALKMSFDAVAIRRLYYDVSRNDNNERFDAEAAFSVLDTDVGLNALRVTLYNIQDCAAVFHLARNLAFSETIAVYARHFAVPLVEAAYTGNSNLLPNAFALRALAKSSTVLPFRRNETAPMVSLHAPSLLETTVAAAAATTDSTVRRSVREMFDASTSCCLAAKNDSTLFVRRMRDNATTLEIDRSLWKNESRRCDVWSEKELIAVDEKSYIGGVNSAESGHYEYPVTIDFSSFYPSIGCQYGLSMETVVATTVQRAILTFGEITNLNAAMNTGLIRAFDYEPPNRVRPPNAEDAIDIRARGIFGDPPQRYAVRRTNADGNYILRGRDDVSTGTLAKYNGWYEGVEFRNAYEMIESSESPTERRILLVFRPHVKYVPVIVGLWKHYLSARRRYKSLLRETAKTDSDMPKRRVYECMEKMYKVVANSLYGYLNYERSVVYAPAVAAAITLLSRKTFHETTWICEEHFPRSIATKYPETKCRVVYRDTDGLILHAYQERDSSNSTTESHRRRQSEYEGAVVREINNAMRARGDDSIVIELDDEGLRSCCIMGKKKYWKVSGRPDGYEYTTKGFEKNAPVYVKRLILTLQLNVMRFVDVCVSDDDGDDRPFRLILANVEAFFGSVFSALSLYEKRHGVRAFSFGVKLNPRTTDGTEARFIQNTLTDYSFAIGDRADSLFVRSRNNDNIYTARLILVRDFNDSEDLVDYYKLIRRVAVYALQTVEGFKRAETSDVHLSARDFDKLLLSSYEKWLLSTRPNNDVTATFENEPYHALLHGFDEVATSMEETAVVTSSLIRLKNAGLLRVERIDHLPDARK